MEQSSKRQRTHTLDSLPRFWRTGQGFVPYFSHGSRSRKPISAGAWGFVPSYLTLSPAQTHASQVRISSRILTRNEQRTRQHKQARCSCSLIDCDALRALSVPDRGCRSREREACEPVNACLAYGFWSLSFRPPHHSPLPHTTLACRVAVHPTPLMRHIHTS